MEYSAEIYSALSSLRSVKLRKTIMARYFTKLETKKYVINYTTCKIINNPNCDEYDQQYECIASLVNHIVNNYCEDEIIEFIMATKKHKVVF